MNSVGVRWPSERVVDADWSAWTHGAPYVPRDSRWIPAIIALSSVARLMRTAQLQGVSRRKVHTTLRDEAASPAPDLVARQFTTAGPDRLWVADITYIPIWTRFLYLAVVLDGWSRRVIGWAMETHLRTALVLAALDMALAERRPTEVMHHSNHGCQYVDQLAPDTASRR
jgi:putative transposase